MLELMPGETRGKMIFTVFFLNRSEVFGEKTFGGVDEGDLIKIC